MFSTVSINFWPKEPVPPVISIDLLFIDGDHTKKGVLKDWNNYSEMIFFFNAELLDGKSAEIE